MIKILVTGGAGNVGGALARKLVENQNYYVVIADDLSTGSKEKLPSKEFSNWDFVYCDVNNYKEISEIMLVNKFDFVFHYAAVVGVKRTQDNPIMVLNDIEGIRNVLQLSKNSSVKRVFFSSSSEVYGEPVDTFKKMLKKNSIKLPENLARDMSEKDFLKMYEIGKKMENPLRHIFGNNWISKFSEDFALDIYKRI